MKKTPLGWPRISSALFYEDPKKAIEWLCHAFGFVVRIKVEEAGTIMHSELTFGDGVVMVAGTAPTAHRPDTKWKTSPRAVAGGNTQSMFIYVDDIEAHCTQARAAGARILAEPTTSDYGAAYWADRGYECEDPEGHHWWFAQRLRDPPSGATA